MKYYIIAGEASGDLHGSNLIRQLHAVDQEALIRCWGGDLMEQAGAVLVKHYRDLAFMGFAEVLMNLRTIFRNLDACKKDVQAYAPDVLILIDYPGFNLRMAAWAHQHGFKVVYYISPQVWAWKESRVKKIRKYVDKMLVILPFEKAFYHKWGYDVEYIGHPLVEVIRHEMEKPLLQPLPGKPVVALLPGSRRQEVSVKLPVMLQMTKYFPEYRFVIAQAPSLDDRFMQEIISGNEDAYCVKGLTYDLLKQARAAVVTSGTATLETALFGVPQVVCYKGSFLSYLFARYLVKVKYISLVNLIMDRQVVKELIQNDLTEKNLHHELTLLLKSEEVRERMQADYAALWNKLGEGDASGKAARSIYNFMKKDDGKAVQAIQ